MTKILCDFCNKDITSIYKRFVISVGYNFGKGFYSNNYSCCKKCGKKSNKILERIENNLSSFHFVDFIKKQLESKGE